MKSMTVAALGAAWFVSASAGAQTVMEHSQALKPTVTPAQIIGPDKPQLQPPVSHESLTAALAKAGKFNTFIALWKVAGMDDWERKANWDGDGKAGFADGSVRGVTILAPNDAAFAAMDKGKLAGLEKEPAAARAFVLAHVVSQPLKVVDMFYAENPTSEKFFKGAAGGEFKLLCDGRAHVGLHHPRINGGIARIGDVQDVAFAGGMVQEIDGVLAP